MNELCLNYIRLEESISKLEEEKNTVKNNYLDLKNMFNEARDIFFITISFFPNILLSLMFSLDLFGFFIIESVHILTYLILNVLLMSFLIPNYNKYLSFINKCFRFKYNKKEIYEMKGFYSIFSFLFLIPLFPIFVLFFMDLFLILLIFALLIISLTLSLFSFNKRETFLNLIHYKNDYKKDYKKLSRQLLKLRKEQQEKFELIKKSSDSIIYIKSINEKNGNEYEIALKEKIKKDLEKDFSDNIFELYLRKEKQHFILNS